MKIVQLKAHLFRWGQWLVLPAAAMIALAIAAMTEAGEPRSPVVAQGTAPPKDSRLPLKNQPSPDLKALLAGKPLVGVVTSRTPSSVRLSTPSLWWIRDQLADLDQFGGKFIQEWIAYPGQGGQAGLVDLLVNRQEWSLLDYLQRYEFVRKFSAIARGYGYNTRVYDSPDRLPVALYTCDFSSTICQLEITGSEVQRRRQASP
ncbi:MAG: hypothetical protein NW224_04560 [Leptolyngbyaceae cyanobacterium bins.302]|nr:hypothetical protein [Leptolyngbyaceae cyanobacterium bins.302]